MVVRRPGRENEKRMRELLPLLPVAIGGLLVFVLSLFAIRREKKRSS